MDKDLHAILEEEMPDTPMELIDIIYDYANPYVFFLANYLGVPPEDISKSLIRITSPIIDKFLKENIHEFKDILKRGINRDDLTFQNLHNYKKIGKKSGINRDTYDFLWLSREKLFNLLYESIHFHTDEDSITYPICYYIMEMEEFLEHKDDITFMSNMYTTIYRIKPELTKISTIVKFKHELEEFYNTYRYKFAKLLEILEDNSVADTYALECIYEVPDPEGDFPTGIEIYEKIKELNRNLKTYPIINYTPLDIDERFKITYDFIVDYIATYR